MITFGGNEYELFFSNNLQLLRALNYADELFFSHFERLCGARYRILSVIRNGWQEKYGRSEDVRALEKAFSVKLKEKGWIDAVLEEYESGKESLLTVLQEADGKTFASASKEELAEILRSVRERSALLDAMSNMLYLFSTMSFADMLPRLRAYSTDTEVINRNFVYYTQPVRESRFARILIPELPDRFMLSDEDAALSAVLRAGAYVKDDVSALLEERGQKLSGIFSQIAERLSVRADDVYYLTIPEIITAVKIGKVPDGLIDDRKQVTVIIYPARTIEIYEGADAEAFLKKGHFTSVSVSETSELKGQSASPGKVSGTCVVVKNSEEAVRLISRGDILVAPYTAPEYLPAMKMAAAIITETGGITSHAAIVSRELKVPCVIAVKGATSLLKTGDMVEVDANAGIVRKL